MTREQAINYLKSSGMSDEQIETVVDAFTCEDCISRTELLSRIDAERKYLLDLKMDGAEHILVHHARRIVEDMPSVAPQPKMGHWIWELQDWNKWTCSVCGWAKRTDVHITLGYKYCPNCGADMRGEEERESDED